MSDFFGSGTRVVNCKNDRYDVYVGRPSKWGNPFVLGEDGDRKEVLDKYKRYMWYRIRFDPAGSLSELSKLEGAVLGCYCKPKACHGDVLVSLVDLVVDLKRHNYSGGELERKFLDGVKELLYEQ